MFSAWSVLCALVAWCSLVGGEGGCPAGCEWCGGGAGDLLEYTCQQYTIKYRDDGYAEIDCRGGSLNCSAIPDVGSFGGGVLRRVEVTSCSLPPAEPLACLPRALRAARARALTLTHTTTLTEHNMRGMEHIETLIIIKPLSMSALPREALSALVSLRELRVLYAPSLTLTPSALPPLPLTYLELSMGGLAALPANAFSGLTQLETLNLFGNEIQNIEEGAFEGIPSVRTLVLNSNPLESLPAGELARLPRLHSLALTDTALTNITSDTLRGLDQLQQLTVQSSSPLSLSPLPLPSLRSLSVTSTPLAPLPPSLLAHTSLLVNITLAWDHIAAIPAGLFDNLSAVQLLDLSHNKISVISRDMFADLTSLVRVDLSYNNITHIPERIFSGLTNLQHLSMSHNSLHSISPQAFITTPSLATLDLSHNSLTLPSPSPSAGSPQYEVWLEAHSPLESLLSLEVLDLSYNRLTHLYTDWRVILLRLNTLDLSHNNIQEIQSSDYQFLSATVAVDLSYNQLTALPPPLPLSLTQSSPPSPSTTHPTFILANNPYKCDCQMYPFIKYIQEHNDARFDVRDATCDTPPTQHNTTLVHVTRDALVCRLPQNYTHCLYRPQRYRIECEITDITTNIPDPTDYGVQNMYIKLDKPIDLTQLPEYVREVNMSGLGIHDIGDIPKHIQLIDLTDNKLNNIPTSVFESNATLRLANNSIECDCWHADNVRRIQANTRAIADYTRVVCEDGVPLEGVDVQRLCTVYTGGVVGAALAGLGVLVAVVVALLYRYSLQIQVFLYTRGWCRRLWDGEGEGGAEGAPYDVFLWFSEEDAQWTRAALLPPLEREYAVCVAARDWVAGEPVAAQLHRAVAASRCTVAVASEAFARSPWGAEAVRAARAARRGVLLVLPGGVEPALPADLRPLLRSAAALTYTHSRFWDRLRFALRPRTPPRAPLGGDKPQGGLNVVINNEGKLVNNGFIKE